MIKLSSLIFFPVRWAPAKPAFPYSLLYLFGGRPPKGSRRARRGGTPQGAGSRANCPTKLSKNPATQRQRAAVKTDHCTASRRVVNPFFQPLRGHPAGKTATPDRSRPLSTTKSQPSRLFSQLCHIYFTFHRNNLCVNVFAPDIGRPIGLDQFGIAFILDAFQ